MDSYGVSVTNTCHGDFEKEVIDRLARIETKLETAESHEQRIQNLEASVNQGKGIKAVITAFVCALSGLFGAIGGRML